MKKIIIFAFAFVLAAGAPSIVLAKTHDNQTSSSQAKTKSDNQQQKKNIKKKQASKKKGAGGVCFSCVH